MSKLKCNERSCRHNSFCLCSKQCIVLDEDAVCCSFQKEVPPDNYPHYEFSKEISPSYADVETTINYNNFTTFGMLFT